MIVTISAQQTVEEVCGQEYLLQLPGARLSQERTWTLPTTIESISLPVSVRKIAKNQDTGWSFSLIVIMVALLHLVIILVIGMIFTIYHRLHPSLRKRFAVSRRPSQIGRKAFQNPLPENGIGPALSEEIKPATDVSESQRTKESKSLRESDPLDATLKDLVLDALSAIGPAKTVSEAKGQDALTVTMIEPPDADSENEYSAQEFSDEESPAKDLAPVATETKAFAAEQEGNQPAELGTHADEMPEASDLSEQPTPDEQPTTNEEQLNEPSVHSQSLSSEELMLALQKMMDELEQTGDSAESPTELAAIAEQEEELVEEPVKEEESVLAQTKPEPVGAVKRKPRLAYQVPAELDAEDLKVDLNDLSF